MNEETELMRTVVENAERYVKAEEVRDGIVLVNAANLEPQPVDWLWNEWLALGKLHLLAGAPGQGKTTLAMSLAAIVTRGGRWPDGSNCTAGSVVIWSGEDDPGDTLLPRLMAAGAKRDKVYFVSGKNINGEFQSFDPARDTAALSKECEQLGDVRLIIVDPISSAVTGDSHKNTETRRALQPLVNLAADMNAALIGITHFSKGGQGVDPTQRVIGSIAFAAVARVVLVAAKVKSADGSDRRIFARSKSNIGPDDGGFEYHLEQIEPQAGLLASVVVWGEKVEGAATELLSEPAEGDKDELNAKETAMEFLREILSSPVQATTVALEAKAQGISARTLRRAADALRVKSRRGHGNVFYWSLPQ
ncbi:AAA family ATPase [Paraburkholderia acidisoli]|uniref:AAA family ATPase n=1 Tax=Paraburkholderia acidisoli TaxID=2571748 RepID=A0A7Z2GG82_9BURK|nr:AAA family ATPase [Paraburkholderia acidisoli]QGZ61078.1 AAA family ATPase [Paraburkholderia acidisoli]